MIATGVPDANTRVVHQLAPDGAVELFALELDPDNDWSQPTPPPQTAHFMIERSAVSDRGTPTGRSAERGAGSRGLTWGVSLGWYESILIEGPLFVAPPG
jgi:hypothetical protein